MENEHIERTSRRCTVKYSEICKFLGCDGCAACTLSKPSIKEYEKKRTNEIWEVTKTLLPENADEVHTSETCLFCKSRPGAEKIGYGLADIAHQEPEEHQGMLYGIGTKMKMPVGSMLQLPIPMCKSCKRKYSFLENLRFWGLGGGFFLGLLMVWILSPTDLMQYSDALMPIMFLAAGMVLGYLGGRWLSGWWIKRTQNDVYYHIFDIPEVQAFKENGWFELNQENSKTRIFFSKKKPRKNFVFFSKEVFPEEEQQAIDEEITEPKDV